MTQKNLFQSVKSFVNSKGSGNEFTTKEFHLAMSGIESLTRFKVSNNNPFYRSNQYRTYLKRVGFVSNIERGRWKVVSSVPDWFDSGTANFILGYLYKQTVYNGLTREQTKEKIRLHVSCIENNKTAPSIKQEVKSAPQPSGYCAADLARELVGDGDKENNLWFVTCGPFICVNSDGECDSELLEGFDPEKDTHTYGPFTSYENACKKYDSIDLDFREGIGQVFIEDRAYGQIKEKFLEKVVIVDYSYNEHDSSKYFYKK